MGRICDNCVKSDVCKFKEECIKAARDILDIEERTNVFIKTDIFCKKFSGKQILDTARYQNKI